MAVRRRRGHGTGRRGAAIDTTGAMLGHFPQGAPDPSRGPPGPRTWANSLWIPVLDIFDWTTEKRSDLDLDIRLYEQLSAAKSAFFDEIVAHCAAQDADSFNPSDLRSETIFQIAEFYYFLKIFDIQSPARLREFAKIHTDKVAELLNSKEEQAKLGVYPQRLSDALFDTEEKLDRLTIHCGEELLRLSQSDLARLLIEYMSPETCRQAVKVLGLAGYVRLSKSPFGAVLVASSGELEAIFAQYVRDLRMAIFSDIA